MTEPFCILVVCTGNLCRSPLAERLFHARLGDAASFDVRSAGIQGVDGAPMDERAAVELRRLGGSPEGFRARTLTPAYVEAADLVLTATLWHRSAVLVEAPAAMRRTFTLLELADLAPYSGADLTGVVRDGARRRSSATLADYDLADPIGASPDVHRQVADQIDIAVATIVGGLLSVSS